MKVYINGRFLCRRLTGVDRFAIETIKELNELIAENHQSIKEIEYFIVVPHGAEINITFSHLKIIRFGFFKNQLWEQFSLPFLIFNKKAILLNLCNTGPLICRRQIVVIHDAAIKRVPETFSFRFRLWYGILMPILGQFAKEIITVSQYSKHDLIDFFKIPNSKISVVGEGGEHIAKFNSDLDIFNRTNVRPNTYILAVSSHAPHKNFSLIADALKNISKECEVSFLIAGGTNPKIFSESIDMHSGKIKLLGYVSDNELKALYSNALCFIFPSLYEGFGIPPLEAMNCSCPVLASNAASIPEVCGDAALYFSPTDSDKLAHLIEYVINNKKIRDELKIKGIERAHIFSWRNTAIKVANSCNKVLRES
ncbi:glycosyltransferase family 4 protein [Methylobacillus methanolivorans]|uniref:Glycosyltransferase family 4 protein n=1 Tax=Methylobacillus methanolivorans TaxID=1848927 RepID=A0ABW8GH33_9PROT